MKGKHLAILLAAVVVLGGLWTLAGGLRNGAWSDTGSGGGKVLTFPLNDVTQVVITSSAGELHLVKKADQWTVQERADYPANFDEVSSLLRKLSDLKQVQDVKVGPSQLGRLELTDPRKGPKTGTLVQLLGADGKVLDAVVLGKTYLRKSAGGDVQFGGGGADGYPAGRYAKRLDGEGVSLVAETFDDADPKPARWLAKEFVKISGANTITVAGPTDAQHWSLSREDASTPWKLVDAKADETLDASKVAGFDSTLSSLAFNDVLAPDAKLGEPVTTVNVATADGFHYEIKAGPPQTENDPVLIRVTADFPKERTPGKDEKPEDKTRLDAEFATKRKEFEDKLAKEKAFEGRPYLIAKSTVDSLVKDRAAILSPKPEPTPTPTPVPAPAPVPTLIPAPVAPPVPPVATPTPAAMVPAETPATAPPPVLPSPPASPAKVLPTPSEIPSLSVPAPATTPVPSPTPAERLGPPASPFPTPADVPTATPMSPIPDTTPVP